MKHMAQMVEINVQKLTVVKPVGKNPLSRPQCRRGNNVKFSPE